MEKAENQTKNVKVELSWWPFWAAGFMFSLGLGVFPTDLSVMKWWEQLASVLMMWFTWPLFLGLHFAG